MTLPLHITDHAIDRWIERIDPRATPAEVRARIGLHDRVIRFAASFGAPSVRLANGAKLVLQRNDADIAVVTVLGRGQFHNGRAPR